MKKYLMIGFAAVAFAACSNHDFETMTQEQIIQAEYKANFVQQFGQPASNHTWGFGSSSTRAFTRAENANANEWANNINNDNTGHGGWIVPDPLTEGQKERVKAYFQANPNLTNQDPHWKNFFVQQVYKGGSTTAGANSTEVVVAADGSEYTSDNMNLLTVGQANVHINNFNKGTATTLSVLDNGSDILAGKTSYHNDEIMLMVDIDDTSCFGYHETGSSNERSTVNHNDKWALVAASVIDTWAAANGNPGEAVTDKWNRSFIGFDLAIKEGDQCFMLDDNNEVVYANYSQLPESCTWWDNDAQKNYVVAWDGSKVIKVGELNADWTTKWYAGYETLAKTNGTQAGWLDTNKNFYVAGESKTIASSSQSALTDESVILKEFTIDGIKYQALINLPAIQGLLDEGYLPVNNKSLREWVKPGKSDGYFSDWIVTCTEAQRQTPSSVTYEGRIMVEDLSARADVTGKNSDWDFNDVVFDWAIVDGKAYIKLLAAGGTLPIRIGGTRSDNVSEPANSVEIHSADKGLGGYMVNTGVNVGKTYSEFVLEDHDYSELGAKGILITVQKGGEWVEIQAEQGEPAAKFNCKVGTKWCDEYVNITRVYPDFTTWVANPAVDWTQGDGSTSRLTDGDLSNNE